MVEKYVKQGAQPCEKRLRELNAEAADNGGLHAMKPRSDELSLRWRHCAIALSWREP